MGILQIFTLLGAMGMFLYGMNLMSSGLQKAAGDRLRGFLSAMTSNPFKRVMTGVGITALIQSSSATTVMVVSFVNAGLLTYPTLMAADILIHKSNYIPVGKDQEQNLEKARDFAERFNRIYGIDYFPVPQAFNFGNELIKVPGLDGSGKMGKSEGEGNAIFLYEDDKSIRKKVMRAVTDSGPTEPNQVKPEPIQNLFNLMKIVSKPETVQFFDEAYNNMSIRYGDMKKQLAEDIIQMVTPFRERINELSSNDEYIKKVARMGAEKAHESASKTIKEVREIIGFRSF